MSRKRKILLLAPTSLQPAATGVFATPVLPHSLPGRVRSVEGRQTFPSLWLLNPSRVLEEGVIHSPPTIHYPAVRLVILRDLPLPFRSLCEKTVSQKETLFSADHDFTCKCCS